MDLFAVRRSNEQTRPQGRSATAIREHHSLAILLTMIVPFQFGWSAALSSRGKPVPMQDATAETTIYAGSEPSCLLGDQTVLRNGILAHRHLHRHEPTTHTHEHLPDAHLRYRLLTGYLVAVWGYGVAFPVLAAIIAASAVVFVFALKPVAPAA